MKRTAPMKNIAVILAGGSGSRLGADRPKQFLPLKDGRTVLETCVDAFHQNEHIDEIAVVMLRDHIAEAQALLPASRFPKIKYWIPGGAERWESSKNAVEAIYLVQQKIGFPEEDINVLLHDCARPFISQDLITRVCQALEKHEAVTVALPVTDTIYVTETTRQGEMVVDVAPRKMLRKAQTPQAFRLLLIADAYEELQDEQKAKLTDDASVVLAAYDENIFILPGEESNKKITYKEDI